MFRKAQIWLMVIALSCLVGFAHDAASAAPQGQQTQTLQSRPSVPEAVPIVPLADTDMDGFPVPTDCNDLDNQIFPGAPERCNSVDDDCDGLADETFPTLGDECTVGLGECEATGEIVCDGPSAVACDAVVGTPTAEICDGLDNDCNGSADFPGETTDADGDTVLACNDCEDTDPDNYPGNTEFCDGHDNDCDGVPDDGLTDTDGDHVGDTCDLCPQDPGGIPIPLVWEQGFETDTAGWLDQNSGWFGTVLQQTSGTDGVPSADGGFHATMTQSDDTGPFTRFDGYRSYWPGGFTATIDVYLDTTWAAGEGFDYSVAATGTDGAHQRDFIFHVTQDTSTGDLLVGASNNTTFDPREDLESINHAVVTTTGWYTLRHVFRDQNGVLAVDMQLLDDLGTVLFTETRSTLADVIGTEVGGNRYGWFTHIDIAGGVEVDNHTLTLGTGDGDGDGVCDSDDICQGGDDAIDGDGDGVPAFCDCDDADSNNYPGNAEICDGFDNDCSATGGVTALAVNGWFSDDTRYDGGGVLVAAAGTNLVSDTLTDDPEASATGTPLHDTEITRQIALAAAPGTVPSGTHPYAAHLSISVVGGGSGKSQMSHRKNDGVGHAPGSVLEDFFAEYSWMGDGPPAITASLKLGVKTSEFATTGVSGRTGENAWDKILIYEPGNLNGGLADGMWHTETLSHTSGKWWFFDRKAGASTIGTPMTFADMSTSAVLVGGGPKTVADVYALITAPGAHITSVQFGIGSGNAGGSVYVNQLETDFYRPGEVTTFGGPGSGANFPGELVDGDGDMSLSCNDCDDADPDNFPGNLEVCDGQDNDCDLIVPPTEIDDDGDMQAECEGDCDDGDPLRYAGNLEVCDGIDNDCDLIVPPTEIDDDGDMQAECEGDCDDGEPLAYLGNTEVCGDGIDNNCDTFVDSGDRFVANGGVDAANDCTAGGSPCATIQHAIDASCDGDTVHVASGTYPESLDIDAPVTVSCANAGIPWNGVRVAESVIDASGFAVGADISGSSVAIDGCEIVGGAPTYAGVQLFNGTTDILDVSIDNNRIHGMRLPNPFAAFTDLAYGVFAVTGSPGARHEVRGLSIAGNEVYDIGVLGVAGGTGAYLNNVIGAAPGDGVTISGNRFFDMKTGPGAFDLGTGVVIDAGADNGVGAAIAPSSGALVTGNLYEELVGGAALFTDDSTFDEAHASFTDVTYFLLNIANLGTLATVDEAALAPYARTDDPLTAAFVPGSHLYSPTIQTAVDFSDSGATIDVTAGTFAEQVDVPKSVQIVGAGSGSTTIAAPTLLVNDATFGQNAIVAIHGAGVSTELTGVTVAGPGPAGSCAPTFGLTYGVLVYANAHADIHDNAIVDIRDTPLSGCQRGIAIRVGSQFFSSPATATIADNTVSSYQKGGVVVDGTGSSATITDNDITGVGATPHIAQNGLQISRGATGTASLNTISANLCDHVSCGPSDTTSIGVLMFEAGAGISITDNDIDDNDLGLYNWSSGLTTVDDNGFAINRYFGMFVEEGQALVEDNTISGGLTGVYVYAFAGVAADSEATLLRNTVTADDNGVLIGDGDTGDGFDPLVEAHFNHISGHSVLGMDNETMVTADATCNWWGALDGPGPPEGMGSGDGISTFVDAGTWLLAADFGVDNDNDGVTSCTSDMGGDCDVASDDVYPGAPQICDGLNNDCSDPSWPTLAGGAANETDQDGDTYSLCAGDCNETDTAINPGAVEICDTIDHDCDGFLDNGGADASCDQMNVCQVDSCSGAGACEFVASGDCGISGHVYYDEVTALVDGADLTKPVEDVFVDLTGDFPDDTTTDPAGFYALASVAGDATVTPSRSGFVDDLESLSSADAALIAQVAVQLASFSPLQFECGDVSNNTAISSFDASLVAQKSVNPGVIFPAVTSAGQEWAFSPIDRDYLPAIADQTNQDFIGCFYGDVTLDWPSLGPLSIDAGPGQTGDGGGKSHFQAQTQTQTQAQTDNPNGTTADSIAAQFEPRRWPATLYISGAPQMNDDGSWTYTLGIQDADGIVALDLVLIHEAGQVVLVGVTPVGIGGALQAVSHDNADEGRAAIALFGTEPLQGTGAVVELRVQLANGPAGFPFKLEAEANERLIPLRWGADLEPVVLEESPQPAAGGVKQHFESK